MSAECQHDCITQNRLAGELILELLVIYVRKYKINNKLLPQQTRHGCRLPGEPAVKCFLLRQPANAMPGRRVVRKLAWIVSRQGNLEADTNRPFWCPIPETASEHMKWYLYFIHWHYLSISLLTANQFAVHIQCKNFNTDDAYERKYSVNVISLAPL